MSLSSREFYEMFDRSADGGGAPAPAGPGTPRQARSRTSGRHWLVLRGPRHDEEMFTVGGKPAVFSFKEEAEAFLRFRGSGDGWRVEEFWAEELVYMLHGPLSGFGYLALDPPPEVANRVVDSLVSVGREEFLGRLAGGSRPLSLRPVEG